MEYFQPIPDAAVIIPILRARLPKSAHVLNMALMYPSFKAEMSFYTLNKISEAKCWILVRYDREDRGQQFLISPPAHTVELDPNIKNALSTASPNVLNWDLPYEFIGTERFISLFLTEVSLNVGNIVEVIPCNFYYYEREKAKNMVLGPIPSNVDLCTLDSEPGLEYICTIWPFKNERSRIYRTKAVERCPSVGTWVDGTVASGALMNPSGHVGIVTRAQHRNQGLSTLCFQHIIKKISEETELFPCSMVDLKNVASNRVHEKVGLELTNLCDIIFFRG